MNNSINDIIFSAIIGDASGYTLNGMKSAHIKAVFKDMPGYLDPEPALKNSMEKWRKPGLYSSITQFMFIVSASIERNVFRTDRFIEAVKKAPELSESEFSFFREPGLAEQSFISSVRGDKKGQGIPFVFSCSRLLPVSIPLLMTENENVLLDSVLRLISLFKADAATAAHSYIFLKILKELSVTESRGSFFDCVAGAARDGFDFLEGNQHRIFDCGYNPDTLLEEIRIFIGLLDKIIAIKDIGKAEKIICETANMRLKSPVSRGSVNLPQTVFPFAVMLSNLTMPHNAVFHTASREGGAASPLASISAALTTAFYGLDIPESLKAGLANKKKVSGMIDALSLKNFRNEIIDILYESEPGLTSKEIEEYRARNKKEPKKQAPQKKRRDIESEMTKHIVESWTKIDKAKWKKERGKHDS